MITEKQINQVYDDYVKAFNVCAKNEDTMYDLKIVYRDTKDNTPAKGNALQAIDDFQRILDTSQRKMRLASIEINRVNSIVNIQNVHIKYQK